MRINKLVALVLLALLAGSLYTQTASAHVLITDTNGTTGAILHITPNDDPVAGKPAGIYFDIQTGQDLSQAALHLHISDQSGGINESVLVTGKGHTVSGAFIFPLRGLYTMELLIGSKVGGPDIPPLAFSYSVRVTSSVAGSSVKPQVPAWATFGMIISVWCLVATALVAAMRWGKITKQSK